MPLAFNKEKTIRIFWLLFFIIFFFVPIKKFNVFSIDITQTQNNSVPFIVVLFEFFKVLLIKGRLPQLFWSIVSLFILMTAALIYYPIMINSAYLMR